MSHAARWAPGAPALTRLSFVTTGAPVVDDQLVGQLDGPVCGWGRLAAGRRTVDDFNRPKLEGGLR